MRQDKIVEIPFITQFTSYYAVQKPEMITEKTPLIVALHGWGQRSAPFLKTLSPLKGIGALVVAPQAPHQFYMDTATKKVGCNWLTAYQKEQSIEDINRYLDTLIKHLVTEYKLIAPRIFLMGFSQGASVAYRFAVSGLVQPAGLIACGADIPPDVIEKLPLQPAFPVLLAQGKEDSLVQEAVFEANQRILCEVNYPFEEFRYDGGHEITQELCHKVGEWVNSN